MVRDRFKRWPSGRNCMRPVHIADLDMVTRVLLALPPADRPEMARSIVARADVADRFRKHTGRAHPHFGSGTLASAIPRRVDAAQPARCDVQYLDALTVIVSALQCRYGQRDQ